jgi:Protein of unknown function (DUF2867)
MALVAGGDLGQQVARLLLGRTPGRLDPGDHVVGRHRLPALERGPQQLVARGQMHLRFVASVTAEPHLVHVTTAVALKGWRGRVYFAPVRLLHDAVTRSMMAAAARRLAT